MKVTKSGPDTCWLTPAVEAPPETLARRRAWLGG